MIRKRRLLSRFLTMVRIDSPSKRERRIVDHVRRELKGMGFGSREDGVHGHFGGDAGNIWVRVRGNAPKAPRLLINAHLDTVAPGIGIRPRVRGGYVVTDGSTILGADNKAGVSVMLEVLQNLREEDVPHGDLLFLFTVSEEIGLYGAKHIKRADLKADLGITLDGGDVDEIINRAPSQDNIRVEIRGKAAHAGVRPEEGISAIKVASDAISRMKLGRIDMETTANIGMIKGGVARNIVPEKVSLLGEARSRSARKLKSQVAHMKKALRNACARHGARLAMEVTPSYRAFEVRPGSMVMSLVRRAAAKVGIRTEIRPTGGGSDANVFNSLGVPTIILGAGADRVHTGSERLSIDQMYRSAVLVSEIIKGAADVKK